jgi:hypothetical protein
LQRVKFEG